jgi:hypothetical protein
MSSLPLIVTIIVNILATSIIDIGAGLLVGIDFTAVGFRQQVQAAAATNREPAQTAGGDHKACSSCLSRLLKKDLTGHTLSQEESGS